MKLRKLHIEDYKIFKDFDIDFVDEHDEALPIVVLAGVNGSGKTTLLEFMKNFSGMIEINKDNKDFLIVEYRDNLYQLDIQFKKTYESDEMEVLFHNAGIDDINKIKMPLDVMFHFLDSLIYYSTNTTLENIKTLLPKYIENMIFLDGVAPFDSYKKVTEYINEVLHDLKLQIEFDSRDGEGNLFFKNKSGGDKFSIDELSTGEKTLLSKVLYLYLEDIKDKVILIDEPELSLHPSWQNKVLKIYENFAKQNNCQIIIATHSPHIIASAKNEYLRILRKNEDGNIEVIEDLKAEGRDINSILFDVMGEVAYRPKEFDDKIDRLHIAIDDRKIEEAKERLEELKKSYGENDEVVMEAQILIDMFSRDEA